MTGDHGGLTVPDWRLRLAEAWVTRPYSVALSIVLIPLGTSALVLGDDVSVSLSSIDAPTMARLLGFLMLISGVLTLTGYLRRHVFLECLGMGLTAVTEAIYLAAVLLVLEVRGVFAAGMALAILAGSLQRVINLLNLADLVGDQSAREAPGAPDEQ